MITRIRIEAIRDDEDDLAAELNFAINQAMNLAPGKWEFDTVGDYAKNGMVIFETKDAWWGFIVIKRVDV